MRVLLGIVAVGALLIGLPYLVPNRPDASLRDSQAGRQAAALVQAYLMANECAWPTGWEDLRPLHEKEKRIVGTDLYPFDEIRERWEIDFEAAPVQLAGVPYPAGRPPFNVLRQRDGRPTYPGWEPNLRVYWCLRTNAGRQAAAMVIEHLKANRGQWPRSWDDLKAAFDTAVKEDGKHHCSFEQVRACVEIDFDADPDELAKAAPRNGERPFRVIYQQTGRTTRGIWDPNQEVFEYLRHTR